MTATIELPDTRAQEPPPRQRSWVPGLAVAVAVLAVVALALPQTRPVPTAVLSSNPEAAATIADPGAEACRLLIEAHDAGQEARRGEWPDVSELLLTSSNAHLARAGEALRSYASVPAETRIHVLAATRLDGNLGAGCTEVGVSLPAEFFDW